jgi:hypothetical protein
MKNIYRKLTKDQKQRGVIFSSTLSNKMKEQIGDTTHEVFNKDEFKVVKIDRLKKADFFNEYKKYNIIRK